MNGRTPGRIATYVAAIFIAGAAAGGAAGYQWGRKAAFTRPQRPPGDMATHMVERYKKELQLSPDQIAKVEPLVREAMDKVRSLHRENFKQTDAIMKGCGEQILALLDDRQKALYQEMEERRKRWMRERSSERDRSKTSPPGTPPGTPPGKPADLVPGPRPAVTPPTP